MILRFAQGTSQRLDPGLRRGDGRRVRFLRDGRNDKAQHVPWRTDRCHCVPAEPGAGGLTGDKAHGFFAPARCGPCPEKLSHLHDARDRFAACAACGFGTLVPAVAGKSIRRTSAGGPVPRCHALSCLPALCALQRRALRRSGCRPTGLSSSRALTGPLSCGKGQAFM
jgi:hypothetical protein